MRTVLSVIDPVRASESLAREAVTELGASGAAVMDGSGALVASAGTWPSLSTGAVTEVRLGDSGPIRSILVGPRTDGRAYVADDLVALEEVGRLTAIGVRPA